MMHFGTWTWHPTMMLLVAALGIAPAWRICSKASAPVPLAHRQPLSFCISSPSQSGP
jgi:hypothetical protein